MDINADKIISELEKIAQYIADKMEIPIQKAYNILLKRIYFDMSWAIVELIIGIAIFIVAIISTRKLYKWMCTKNYRFDSDYTGTIWEWIGTGVAYFIGFLLITINIHTVLEIAISPEWYMIDKIINLIN